MGKKIQVEIHGLLGGLEDNVALAVYGYIGVQEVDCVVWGIFLRGK